MKLHKDHLSKNKITGALDANASSMASFVVTRGDAHTAKEDTMMTNASSHTSHVVKTYAGFQLITPTMVWYVPSSFLDRSTTIVWRKTMYTIRTNMHWWDNALRGGVML